VLFAGMLTWDLSHSEKAYPGEEGKDAESIKRYRYCPLEGPFDSYIAIYSDHTR